MAKIKEIRSVQNPLVKYIVRLRQNHDYREEHQSVIIEGAKLINEVCHQRPAKRIFVYDRTYIPPHIRCDEVLVVTEPVMQKISGVQHPEGIIAEVSLPQPATLKGLQRILVCDGVNDPGNLGALLRTALALGWDGAFLLNNSCDPFNDKALRAAKGATFSLPIAHGNWKTLQELIKTNKLQPLVADMEGTPIEKVSIKQGVLLVMSNEAQGVSEEAAQQCQKVQIPMPGPMESLNVAIAGGILMYALKPSRK